MKPNYWLDLFTGTTWEEFQKAGSSVSGFRESRWKIVQKIAKGDYFLYYLTGVSHFIGILEVASVPCKRADREIWHDDDFPCRFKVKPIVELTPDTTIPVFELRDRFSCFQNLTSPHAWTGHFRSSPAKWKQTDGEAVVQALLDARDNPVKRPTFCRLRPPVSEICRFISFSGLKEQIKQAAAYVRYLKPEFLDEHSESCELEEA